MRYCSGFLIQPPSPPSAIFLPSTARGVDEAGQASVGDVLAEPLDDVDLGTLLRGARGVTGVGRLHPQRGMLALQRLELDAGRDHSVGDRMRAADVAVQPVLELAEDLVGVVGLLRLAQ